jgi:Cu+-exporting ATPase
MGHNNLFIKDGNVVEKMARLTTVVFDKTGTITQSGAMTPVFIGPELNHEQKSMIYSLVRHSTHPLSMLLAGNLSGGDVYSLKNFAEHRGKGLEAVIKGYPVRIGSGRWLGVKMDDKIDVSSVYVSIDNDILGYFKIAGLFRKGLHQVITAIKSKYAVALLSGDNDSEKERVADIFGNDSDLYFNRSPQDKLAHVNRLIMQGEKVAMIGDGLNDAGALRAASVGLTISESGASFSPACDGILSASAFRLLPRFFDLAEHTLGIIKISFAISFLYNVIGLVFAVRGLLSPLFAAILMPVSSITVVLFTTLATAFVARRKDLF